MDRSDEQEIEAISSPSALCPTKSMFDCDEFLCKKNEISCGDGQCVHWTNIINHQQSCTNRRDAFYRCEILMGTTTYSTLGSGLCRSGQVPPMNLTSCTTNVQSILRRKNKKVSFEYIMTNCPLLIPVPSGPILTSNLKFFYNKSIIAAFYNSSISFAKDMPLLPHAPCFTGSLICNNTKITLNYDYCFSYDEFQAMSIHPFFPVSHIFCNITLTIPLK